MKKYVLILPAFLLSVSVSVAAEIPVYDSAAYCKKVAEAGGGSYMVESGCMDMEKDFRNALEAMEIEPKILAYCDKLSKAGGGSYMIFHGCVDMEMESKKSLAN